MAQDERFAFCFVGGGSEFGKVQQFAATNQLKNILCLPYQPLDVGESMFRWGCAMSVLLVGVNGMSLART